MTVVAADLKDFVGQDTVTLKKGEVGALRAIDNQDKLQAQQAQAVTTITSNISQASTLILVDGKAQDAQQWLATTTVTNNSRIQQLMDEQRFNPEVGINGLRYVFIQDDIHGQQDADLAKLIENGTLKPGNYKADVTFVFSDGAIVPFSQFKFTIS